MVRVCVILALAGSAMASVMVSRIVVPLSKLTKYEDAAAACESEGLRLVHLGNEESMDYITGTLVEKNLDRVWIAGRGGDERKNLALEVFEGVPITYRIDQVGDEEKMLAVLCEPAMFDEAIEMGILQDKATEEKSTEEETKTPTEAFASEVNSAELPKLIENLTIYESVVDAEEAGPEGSVVICTFDVDEETKSVQIDGSTAEQEEEDEEVKQEGQEQEELIVDVIKSKGGANRRYERSSGSRYERPRSRNRRSSRCSSTSSSSSSCESSFTCDPFDPSGSSSSRSSSSSSCRSRDGRRRNCRSRRRESRRRRNRFCSPSSSSTSSSSEDCGTGRCGSSRHSTRFRREIRLTQRIN